MKDDQKAPLLSKQLEEEFELLMEDNKVFNSQIDELTKTIGQLNTKEPSSISIIKANFDKVTKKLNQISGRINYIKNFSKSDYQARQLKKLSDAVSAKYSKANEIIISVVGKQKNEIESEIENSNENELLKDKIVFDSSSSRKIDSLLERKKECERILQITNQINEISSAMKSHTQYQNELVNNIADNVIEVDDNIKKADGELDKLAKKESGSNKIYVYISISAIAVISVIAFLLYLKLRS